MKRLWFMIAVMMLISISAAFSFVYADAESESSAVTTSTTPQDAAKEETDLAYLNSIAQDNPGEPLRYIDADGKNQEQTVYKVANTDMFPIGGSFVLDDSDGNHWWAFEGNRELHGGICTVKGDINLVLTDNCVLDGDSEKEVQVEIPGSGGIKVPWTEENYGCLYVTAGSTLTVWCQAGKSGTMRFHGVKDRNPGIVVEKGAKLIINGGNVSGRGFKYAAGIGVDKDATLIINGGNVTGVGGISGYIEWPWEDLQTGKHLNGAGIGSNPRETSGTIEINGGTVTASVDSSNGGYGAAAIGGGGGGSNGKITINGGTVKATGHKYGAGIGSGPRAKSGEIVIKGGDVEATSTRGAGIGSGGWADTGSGDNSNGPITITGGKVKASSGDSDKNTSASGAAIGAGCNSAQGGKITISGGEVEAVVSQRSAAIGGSANDNDGLAGGEIEITGKDTKVTAVAVSGAAIGSGGRSVGANSIGAKGASGGHIVIDGATVLAISTGAGAGIGGGNGGSGGKIEIKSGNVRAYGGYSKYSWTKESSSGSGQGGKSYTGKQDVSGLVEKDSYNKIADAILEAIFGDTFAGSGIGGGSHGSGGTVVVSGGIVEAFAGNNEAKAIGHGRKNNSDGSLTVYEGSKVTYGNWTSDKATNIKVDGRDTTETRAERAHQNSYALIEPSVKVTVTFDVWGKCESPADQVIETGDSATRPATDPAAEGLIFGGWYQDDLCTKPFYFSNPIRQNTTVYAKWLESKTLTVRANWHPANADGRPGEITIQYKLDNVEDDTVAESSDQVRTITLKADKNWQAPINITEESILTLYETETSGFRYGGYTFDNGKKGIELPNSKLNLRDRDDTGLEREDFNRVKYTVRKGNPVINVNYYKQRVYNVTKKWQVFSEQKAYKPDKIKAVLQHKVDGEWETVDTIALQGQSFAGEWTGHFKPVDYDNEPFEDWRIRELDQDGNVVLAKTDYGGKENPAAVFHVTSDTNVDMNMEFEVAYAYNTNEARTTITNSNATDISVTKVWNDNDDQAGRRPEKVTVNLLANGVKVDSREVTANGGLTPSDDVTPSDGWTWTFQDLPIYENGQKISYAVTEDPVADYFTEVSGNEIDGFTVTNRYVPNTTEIYVLKTWDDGDDQEGIRPDSITVHLFADGVDTGKALPLNKDNGWFGNFTNLDKENSEGNPITYTVKEDWSDDRYKSSIAAVEGHENVFIIKNSHETTDVNISGSVNWEDDDDRDGRRPDAVKVWLCSDGKPIARKTVSATDNWAWSFDDFPAYRNGTKVTYTVMETDADTSDPDTADQQNPLRGYKTVITDDDNKVFTITNTHDPETRDIEVTKVWDDDDQAGMRPESVTLDLLANGSKVSSCEIKAENNWKSVFTKQFVFDKGHLIKYEVTEEAVPGYTARVSGDVLSGFAVTNTFTPKKMNISTTITWNDAEDQDGKRPSSVTLNLLADGAEVASKSVTAGSDGSWKWTFENVPVYTNGKKIKYSITENPIDGYTAEIEGDGDDGFVVTNTHKPETRTVSGTKVWDDNQNQDGKRLDNITLNLLANGSKVKSIIVTSSDNWDWAFTDVPVYSGGKKITYTVTEEAVDGYTTDITGDADNGFAITNRHIPETKGIQVTKAWEDNNDQKSSRPAQVTVNLWTNGEKTASQTATASTGWACTFQDLPVYQNGQKIVYAVTENPVADYVAEVSGNDIDGFTITNTYTPGKTQIYVLKTWNDRDDQEGKRPDSITVRLLADGKETGESRILNAENGWFGTFTDLDKNKSGNPIQYTVEENNIAEYESNTVSPEGYANVFVITNTHETEVVNISGSVRWDDDGDRDGRRPDAVRVWLCSDDMPIARKTVSATDNQAWSFEAFPAYRNGKPVVYTVIESAADTSDYTEPISGYTTDIAGDAGTGFVITNTRAPYVRDIEVTKVWDDDDDQDGKRPESVTLRLLADGEKVDEAKVTAKDNWKYIFKNKVVFKNRGDKIDKIKYTVTEEDVPDYTTRVSGDVLSGFTVTNMHVPEMTQVYAVKSWDDADNRYGIRPDKVTLHLLANGHDTGVTLEVKESNGWIGYLDNLDKYHAGELIQYTVKEDPIPGYQAQIEPYPDPDWNLFSITNTYQPTPYHPTYNITYDLNGGVYNNSTENIVEHYPAGTVISIHEEPTREGYRFTYWKGSEYQPGDKYMVNGNHTFVAQWEKDSDPTDPDDPTNPSDPTDPDDPDDPTDPTDPGDPTDPADPTDPGSSNDPPGSGRTTSTGDSTPVGLLTLLLLTSAALFGTVVLRRRGE